MPVLSGSSKEPESHHDLGLTSWQPLNIYYQHQVTSQLIAHPGYMEAPLPSVFRVEIEQTRGLVSSWRFLFSWILWSPWIFIFLGFIYLFLERREGREKEGVKRECVLAPHTGEVACNLGMCPDWESNQRRFGSQTRAQSTELHQPGPEVLGCLYTSTDLILFYT